MYNDDPTQVVCCYICKNPTPRAFCHEHHKIPQAAGGSDDPSNLTLLCAGCHMNLHRVADLLHSGNQGIAIDVAGSYTSLPARRRLFELANLVTKEMVLKADAPFDPEEEKTIQIKLTARDWVRLKSFASENFHSNGRSWGVSRLVKMIVLDYLNKKSRGG